MSLKPTKMVTALTAEIDCDQTAMGLHLSRLQYSS
jgi:hypothetical protein